jgi:hypothetical protein
LLLTRGQQTSKTLNWSTMSRGVEMRIVHRRNDESHIVCFEISHSKSCLDVRMVSSEIGHQCGWWKTTLPTTSLIGSNANRFGSYRIIAEGALAPDAPPKIVALDPASGRLNKALPKTAKTYRNSGTMPRPEGDLYRSPHRNDTGRTSPGAPPPSVGGYGPQNPRKGFGGPQHPNPGGSGGREPPKIKRRVWGEEAFKGPFIGPLKGPLSALLNGPV